MSYWDKIDTAPKDGTTITVRQGRLAPYHVFWKDNRWEPIEYFHGSVPTEWFRELAPDALSSSIKDTKP